MFKLYLQLARRYVVRAVLPAVLIGLLVGLYYGRQPKIYAASTSLYVQQPVASSPGLAGGTDVQGSTLLTPTFNEMITDPAFLQRVDNVMDRQYPGYRIERHNLTTDEQPGETTSLIKLSLQDTDPARAAVAANTVAKVFIKRISALSTQRFQADEQSLTRHAAAAQEQIKAVTSELKRADSAAEQSALRATLDADSSTYQTLLASLAQFRVQKDTMTNTVHVYYPATPSFTPVAPKPTQDGILAGLAALLLLGGLVRYSEFRDDSFNGPEEVEAIAGAPLLGTIHHFDSKQVKRLVSVEQPNSQPAEAYRLIRTNLQFVSSDRGLRTIQVTSAHAGEGKSTTIANLASLFAGAGKEVTIVDGDLRRPSVHRLFDVSDSEGLTSIISEGRVNGHVKAVADVPNLAVVPAGPPQLNPSELLSAPRLPVILRELEGPRENRMVLIDSPPILPVADASILAGIVDGVVLVMDINKTKRRDLQRAVRLIEQVGGKLLGVVVNQLDSSSATYYYRHYGYGYGYGYGYSAYSSNRPKAESKRDEKVAQNSGR